MLPKEELNLYDSSVSMSAHSVTIYVENLKISCQPQKITRIMVYKKSSLGEVNY